MNADHDARVASSAKVKLYKQFADRAWFRGVGIIRLDDGAYALRVNVAPTGPTPGESLPSHVDGIEVIALRVDGYRPRENEPS